MTKKKAYYNNGEILSMISGGSVKEVCDILERQIKRGQNKTLFSDFGRYTSKKYSDIDPMILISAKEIVNWKDISKIKLSIKSIKVLIDYLDMERICSEENGLLEDYDFIERNLDILDMTTICKRRKIDREFIERFKKHINWKSIELNSSLGLDTVIHYFENINLNNWIARVKNYNIMKDKIRIVKLINLNVLSPEYIIRNTSYCRSEFLEYLLEEHNYEFSDSEKNLIVEKGYSRFIEKHHNIFDVLTIFNNFTEDGYTKLWRKLSTRTLEKLYDVEKLASYNSVVLAKYQDLSPEFLRKFIGCINNVDFAEILCKSANLPYDMIEFIHNYIATSNRPSSRYGSIIRNSNRLLMNSYDETIKIVNLLNFSRRDFDLLLKRYQQNQYGSKLSLKNYDDLINLYMKYDIVEKMQMKYKFYDSLYIGNETNEESLKVIYTFMEEYIKYMNEIPVNFLNDRLIHYFSKDYIMNLIKDNCKVTNVMRVVFNYELDSDDISYLLSLPLNTKEKTNLKDAICSSQKINDIKLVKSIIDNLGLKLSKSNVKYIIKNNNVTEDFAEFLIDNMEDGMDYEFNDILLELFMNMNVKYSDIVRLTKGDESYLSYIKTHSINREWFRRVDMSDESFDILLDEKCSLDGAVFINNSYKSKSTDISSNTTVVEYSQDKNKFMTLMKSDELSNKMNIYYYGTHYAGNVEKNDVLGFCVLTDTDDYIIYTKKATIKKPIVKRI